LTRPEYDELQKITDSWYYTYLLFDDEGKLKAHITNDDYCAWTDVPNNVIASGLWDVFEFANDAEKFDLKKYLEGEDVVYPATIYDGSPHPKAGQVQHWDGMDGWFTTLITNNVLAAEHWAKEFGLDMNKWKFVEYKDDETTYEAIQKEIIERLEEYIKAHDPNNPDAWAGELADDDPAVLALDTMKKATA